MTRYCRVLAALAGAVLLAGLAFPASAFADNCSNLSDCYSTVSAMAGVASGIAVLFIFTAWISPDRCEGLRTACRQATAEADAAKVAADESRRRAHDLARQSGTPLERIRKAREGLARLDADERSWVEGSGGRLAGVRLNRDDLRRLHAEEQAIRDRHARGEITTQERERLLARWGDADYVREHAAPWADERLAARKRLQEEIRSAEAETGPAQAKVDQANEGLRSAEAAARSARARADALCQEASECEAGLPPPRWKRRRGRLSGVASGADDREQP